MAENGQVRLAKTARGLNLRSPAARGLPALWLISDTVRLPDPLAAAARLPRGAGVVFRHYDHPARSALAGELAALCRRRGLVLSIAGDARLARRVRAQGLHLPEARMAEAATPAVADFGLITAAAHSRAATDRAASLGIDAVFLSPVFATSSHPGAPVLGAAGFARIARAARCAVFALGGIGAANADALTGSGAAGLAAIGALKGR
jgi:thiamine-phosphate pyrophosphorylase